MSIVEYQPRPLTEEGLKRLKLFRRLGFINQSLNILQDELRGNRPHPIATCPDFVKAVDQYFERALDWVHQLDPENHFAKFSNPKEYQRIKQISETIGLLNRSLVTIARPNPNSIDLRPSNKQFDFQMRYATYVADQKTMRELSPQESQKAFIDYANNTYQSLRSIQENLTSLTMPPSPEKLKKLNQLVEDHLKLVTISKALTSRNFSGTSDQIQNKDFRFNLYKLTKKLTAFFTTQDNNPDARITFTTNFRLENTTTEKAVLQLAIYLPNQEKVMIKIESICDPKFNQFMNKFKATKNMSNLFNWAGTSHEATSFVVKNNSFGTLIELLDQLGLSTRYLSATSHFEISETIPVGNDSKWLQLKDEKITRPSGWRILQRIKKHFLKS